MLGLTYILHYHIKFIGGIDGIICHSWSIFGTSTAVKGLFGKPDEEKESFGGFTATISDKKSNEEQSEDADKED